MRAIRSACALAALLAVVPAGAAEDPFALAEEYARQGELHLMQQAYERILETQPASVRALNGRATALAWRGNYTQAVQVYGQALAAEPGNVDALIGLGYARAWSGDHARALQAFGEAQARAPDSLGARKGEAYVYLWSADYERAEQGFAALAADYPGDGEVLTALGQARLELGATRSAVDAFDLALAADPSRDAARQGRVAAYNSTPLLEASAWYGSTSNADSGLRLVELGYWLDDATRLSARYDDSLSLDNPALARSGETAETVFAGVTRRFSRRWTVSADLGLRQLPDGDQNLYRGEFVWSHERGRVSVGMQIGDHDLGYTDTLNYVGFAIPVGAHWTVESNTYFSETGSDAGKEWRSILNTEYKADTGWSVLLGAGYGRSDETALRPADDVKVAHAVAFVPVFGYHRLNLTFRREQLGSESFNIAMLGFTYRLARN